MPELAGRRYIGILVLCLFTITARAKNLDAVPAAFEINRGQFERQVRFLARGRNYELALLPDRARLALGDARVEMRVAGARRDVAIAGVGELKGKRTTSSATAPSFGEPPFRPGRACAMNRSTAESICFSTAIRRDSNTTSSFAPARRSR